MLPGISYATGCTCIKYESLEAKESTQLTDTVTDGGQKATPESPKAGKPGKTVAKKRNLNIDIKCGNDWTCKKQILTGASQSSP